MKIKVWRLTIIVGVALTAWAIGIVQGQSRDADNWQIQIETPAGRTNLKCVKGCNWGPSDSWFECNGGATCGAVLGQHGLVIHR